MLDWWNKVYFTVLDYDVSRLEFTAVIFGLGAVFLAAHSNILTWPTGFVNIIASFIIYYEVALYSDMFLQIYFFATGIYGWYYWHQQKGTLQPISLLSSNSRWIFTLLIAIFTILICLFISKLHSWLPQTFKTEAAYPYADTFIAVLSIAANYLMAKRILENWLLWILVNCIAIYLYYTKGIKFIAFEYLIFLLLAIMGAWNWHKEWKRYSKAK
jgi:nicotinamide mononucleotide transporter